MLASRVRRSLTGDRTSGAEMLDEGDRGEAVHGGIPHRPHVTVGADARPHEVAGGSTHVRALVAYEDAAGGVLDEGLVLAAALCGMPHNPCLPCVVDSDTEQRVDVGWADD